MLVYIIRYTSRSINPSLPIVSKCIGVGSVLGNIPSFVRQSAEIHWKWCWILLSYNLEQRHAVSISQNWTLMHLKSFFVIIEGKLPLHSSYVIRFSPVSGCIIVTRIKSKAAFKKLFIMNYSVEICVLHLQKLFISSSVPRQLISYESFCYLQHTVCYIHNNWILIRSISTAIWSSVIA